MVRARDSGFGVSDQQSVNSGLGRATCVLVNHVLVLCVCGEGGWYLGRQQGVGSEEELSRIDGSTNKASSTGILFDDMCTRATYASKNVNVNVRKLCCKNQVLNKPKGGDVT